MIKNIICFIHKLINNIKIETKEIKTAPYEIKLINHKIKGLKLLEEK